jgi:gamma-glutamyltranspeptidase/glutathione hydrolase
MSESLGAIATPHHLATTAGVDAYRDGGNAIDAALAAATALAVVYPHNTAVGGDLVALIRTPGGAIFCINATGPAPAAVDVDELRARYGDRSLDRGPDAITVPGAVRGWETIRSYGAALHWADQFRHAIRYAGAGVPVPGSLAAALASDSDVLSRDPGASAVFAPGSTMLRRGELLVQRELAATLDQIAAEGPGALYGGSVGDALASGLQELGCPLTIDDLEQYRPHVTPAISALFNDFRVHTSPPNTQGFALLRTLRALRELDLDGLPADVPADLLGRLFVDGNRVRDTLLADPHFASTDVDGDGFADVLTELRGRGPRAVHPVAAPSIPRGDTVGVATADSHGYAVSLIQSVYGSFGAGIIEPRTGILMQNRGRGFSLDSLSPNVIKGGKRPRHTLMPVLVTSGSDVRWVNSTMGGQGQPQIHAQILLQLLNGRSPQEAVDAPRWVVGARRPGETSDTVYHESDVPGRAIEELSSDGFPLHEVPAHTEFLGHTNVIGVEPGGVFSAGSDPRSDGSAAVVTLAVDA